MKACTLFYSWGNPGVAPRFGSAHAKREREHKCTFMNDGDVSTPPTTVGYPTSDFGMNVFVDSCHGH